MARASLATPLLGLSLRRQWTYVILKPQAPITTTPDYNRAAGDNNGIWHNIQLRAVRQCDPKKIIQQRGRRKKEGEGKRWSSGHRGCVNQDLQMRLVGMEGRHIRCIKSSPVSIRIHAMRAYSIPGPCRQDGWGRSRSSLRAGHIRVPGPGGAEVDCGELLTRSPELLLLHLGLSNQGSADLSLALELSLRLVR